MRAHPIEASLMLASPVEACCCRSGFSREKPEGDLRAQQPKQA
jgi:hypothetical protein